MDVKGKRVLVVGMARSGIASAHFLAQRGAHVIANDQRQRSALSGLDVLDDLPIEWALGETPDTWLDGLDLAVISPGVPIQSEWIAKARQRGIPVVGELELAAAFCRAPIVAITGTNGKTTTTALTGAIFEAAGRRVHVAGNIGTPLIRLADEAQSGDIAVVEVSSFQLESIDTFHPVAAALLNITEDHLNRHHTMEEYTRVKCRIFENQGPDDWAIFPWEDEAVKALGDPLNSQLAYFSIQNPVPCGAYVEEGWILLHMHQGEQPQRVCRVEEVKIIGRHNLANALVALILSATQGVEVPAMAKALKTFAGVEHRLEPVAEFGGVRFINDSKGTNPDSTIKGLEGMSEPTVPILGGYDKGGSFDTLVKAVVENPHIVAAVTLGDTAERIFSSLNEAGFTHVVKARSLEGAVQTAMRLCPPGGTVLFSPACASFDMFDDYEHRGRVFKEIVHQLGDENR